MNFIKLITLSAPLVLGATAAETPTQNGKHLFILSGQSNMRAPLPTSFKAVVGKVFGDDNVIVVTVAQPSQPIRRWYKKWKFPDGQVEEAPKNGKAPTPNGNIYDALMTRVKKAIEGKAIKSVTYIWMQGEADAGSGWGEVYEESFYGILDQIKADLGVDQVNYVLGRINDYWTTARGIVHGDMIRTLQEKIGDAHPYGDWVNTDDLNTGVNPWGGYSLCDGHFPPAAYQVIGERFARKACLLVDPKAQFQSDVFTAVFFDSSDDVASHAAIGCTVTGGQATKGQMTALTDGKFGGANADDSHWLSFSPASDSVTELVLDLKEAKPIEQIGVNLLYQPKSGVSRPTQMTFETSQDGITYKPLGRNITFKADSRNNDTAGEDSQPRTVLALVIGPTDRGKPIESRYFRVRITAPKVAIDEIIVNPIAAK